MLPPNSEIVPEEPKLGASESAGNEDDQPPAATPGGFLADIANFNKKKLRQKTKEGDEKEPPAKAAPAGGLLGDIHSALNRLKKKEEQTVLAKPKEEEHEDKGASCSTTLINSKLPSIKC